MNLCNMPIIRKFEIQKLHGYKNVMIDFENPVKIVIAENGAGKTTILTALDAFLRGDFLGLKGIQFEQISCLLYGVDDPLILEKRHIHNTVTSNEAIQEFVRNIEIDEHAFYSYIIQEFDSKNKDDFRLNPLMSSVYSNSAYGWEELWSKCLDAKIFYGSSLSEEVLKISKILKENLSGFQILYLPTYRRIEKPQKNKNKYGQLGLAGNLRKRKHQSASSINYGLSDVQQRLAEISEEIQRKTNFGYRQISAKIIDELILGSLTENSEQALPDLETLKIFFSRIGNSSLLDVKNLDRINEIYINPKSTKAGTLRYFLGMLADVVNQTSQLEKTVETFVAKVNAYLGASSDSKTLTYDPLQMKVYVKNDWTGDEVEFDDLSSGEKQVISILSYLFLYDTPKIVLIDEPELSLSIEWQQKILPDIVSAPLCHQILAITHSPFIFDNELDSYASALNITRTQAEKALNGQ